VIADRLRLPFGVMDHQLREDFGHLLGGEAKLWTCPAYAKLRIVEGSPPPYFP
jgi:hypothetical protein